MMNEQASARAGTYVWVTDSNRNWTGATFALLRLENPGSTSSESEFIVRYLSFY